MTDALDKADKLTAKLTGWLGGVRGRATEIQLLQRVQRATGTEYANVRSWLVDAAGENGELATEILMVAEEDAADMPGTCRYVVAALREGRVLERMSFPQSGALGGTLGAEVEFEPNAIGLTGMAQKHLEVQQRTGILKDQAHARSLEVVLGKFGELFETAVAGFRAAASAQQEVLTQQGAQNQRLADQLEKKAEREISVIHALEALISRTHERDLALAKEKSRHDMQERVFERLEPAIPAVMNKLIGAPLVPAEAQDALDSLIFSFTPEQLDKVQQVLTPEQTMALGMIAKESHERRQKKQARKEATTP